MHSTPLSPDVLGVRARGQTLTVVYSAECKAIQKANRSTGTLTILIFLFVVSYVILTSLVIEQGRTIESQRALLHEMLQDSTQLATLKGKLIQDENKRAHEKSSLGAGQSAPADQQKSSGSAGKAKDGKRAAGKPEHSTKEAPRRPDSDLQDVRRSNRVI